jgi:hypothetical protein
MEEVEMPRGYVTVEEFINIVAGAVYEAGYFQKGQKYHPEDVASTFATVANSVALGMGHVISQVR